MQLITVNNNVFEVRHGVEVTPVGMKLPERLNEDQWNEIGDQVMRLENASNWIIGDWWLHGKHAYGERKKWVAEQRAKRSQVKSFGALMNIASVCRAYQTSRRREVVSFEMHKELAKLPEARQEKFLDLIEAGEIKTHKELREKISSRKGTKVPKMDPIQYTDSLDKTYLIVDPLPTWHAMVATGNQWHLGCTKCWSIFDVGISIALFAKTKQPNEYIISCDCEGSSRTPTLIKEIK